MLIQHLDFLRRTERLREVDYYFARQLAEWLEKEAQWLPLLGVMLSEELGRGNVCILLDDLALASLQQRYALPPEVSARLPADHQWPALLSASAAVGCGGDSKPLILDGNRLYLQRYWQYEQQLTDNIQQRLQDRLVDTAASRALLDTLFGQSASIDWQKIAAALALQKNFTLINGGPGTGKTTTVSRLLALLLELHAQGGLAKQEGWVGQGGLTKQSSLIKQSVRPLLIKLAAPTGKAAARLSESIRDSKQKLHCSAAIKALIPEEATTVHRLLGLMPDSPLPRYHVGNPLLIDVLVVDEASMIDLPLMAKLFDSLPVSSQVILLGDRDQLSSVEAGNVLADICGAASANVYSSMQWQRLSQLCGIEEQQFLSFTSDKAIAPAMLPSDGSLLEGKSLEGKSSVGAPKIAEAISTLQISHRFSQDSGIQQLASAVNEGDAELSLKVLQTARQGHSDLQFVSQDEETMLKACIEQATTGYAETLQLVAKGGGAAAVLDSYGRYRLLCALRQGRFGVDEMNGQIEMQLRKRGLIRSTSNWYAGRPVMILENDYSIGLFNGDVGVCLDDKLSGQSYAHFFKSDGSVRRLSVSRVPRHQTAYAMTVHKSQGSEFDRVSLLLPAQEQPQANRLVTRELLYTAITRARRVFDLYASCETVRAAVNTPTRRRSGLQDRLWGSLSTDA